MNPFSVRKIGILSGQELVGDALIKLPFLRAVRAAWPSEQVHWITSQGKTAYAGALQATARPLIDVIHETPAWLGGQGAPFFDLLIDTRGRWKLALEARWLPHKVFIAPAFHYLLSDKRPPLFSKRPARLIDRLLQIVELAAGHLPEVTGRLPLPHEMVVKARRILPEGAVYVGFALGAGNAIKKWPLEKFEALARSQVRKGRVPVFLLGPQETEIYDRLFQNIPEAIFPLQAYDVWETKEPRVDFTIAIGACLDVAVTNDSGTSHMLAAADCPLVSLFGPTRASKLAPRTTRGMVLSAQSYGGLAMDLIPLNDVEDATDGVILFQK